MTELDVLAVNTIRALAMDAVEKAQSGHPGMPMGAAPMAHVVWSRHLKFDSSDPEWPDRDRFVLSAGHGSMLLYSLLHLSGYDLGMEELEQFRQWGSRTPGHPENHLTPGVEVTTGPLGQGFANGVGMAAAEAFLAEYFNRPDHSIIDHHTYAIVSDGDLMEGVSSEAASLAGHLGLGKLVYLYDDNQISIEGSTELAFSEDVHTRFQAYGWHVQRVDDGNDMQAIDEAIRQARAERRRPSLIIVPTHIAYGSPNKQDTADAHGAPLGTEEVEATKRALGWDAKELFYIPDEVRALYDDTAARGTSAHGEWKEMLESYRAAHPERAEEFDRWFAGALPEGWREGLPIFGVEDGKLATRKASGKVMNAIAPAVPNFLGGSADLAPSNNTLLEECGDGPCGHFSRDGYSGRNLHFGVREHAMGGFANGMALHGGLRPYAATFLIFSDYMRPSIRLAGLSGAHVVYVFTHDSVGLGEDGPTHQPIEHLASLRAMPNLYVVRPSDANEVTVAWQFALEHDGGPVALVLTRQGVPVLDREELGAAEGLRRGGYILAEAPGGSDAVDVLLLATGSEVQLALEARDELAGEGVGARVVALPCWELFDRQDANYREQVLPPAVEARVAVEAAASFGWERYVGTGGAAVVIDRFGASAPGDRVMKELGLTGANVAAAARSLLDATG